MHSTIFIESLHFVRVEVREEQGNLMAVKIQESAAMRISERGEETIQSTTAHHQQREIINPLISRGRFIVHITLLQPLVFLSNYREKFQLLQSQLL